MRWILLLVLPLVLVITGCKGDDATSTENPDKPVISEVVPSQFSRGADKVAAKIKGSNFTSDALIQVTDGVVIENITIVNASEISLKVSIVPDATPGPRPLTVSTPKGISNSYNISISDNRAPVASFSITPPTGTTGTDFAFNAASSNDPDGTITKYSWNFGDGATGDGKEVTHRFAKGGTFKVVLTVTDNQSAIDKTNRELKIESGIPPTAVYTVSPESGNPSTIFQFNASGSADSDGQIVGYVWNFGDGTKAEGPTVQHQFATAATYPVKLKVFDNEGLMGVLVKELNVTPGGGGDVGSPPVAQFTVTPPSGTLATIFTMDGSASVDPDGTITEFKWNMGDGSTRMGIVVNHKFIAAGTYDVKLVVTDSQGNKNSLTRKVNVTP